MQIALYPWHDYFVNFKDFFIISNFLDRDLIRLANQNSYSNFSLINLFKENFKDINFEKILYEQKYPIENFFRNKKNALSTILLTGAFISSLSLVTSKLLSS